MGFETIFRKVIIIKKKKKASHQLQALQVDAYAPERRLAPRHAKLQRLNGQARISKGLRLIKGKV